jgi:hypothetical protein
MNIYPLKFNMAKLTTVFKANNDNNNRYLQEGVTDVSALTLKLLSTLYIRFVLLLLSSSRYKESFDHNTYLKHYTKL